MTCEICNSDIFKYDKNLSCECANCGILYNLQTKALDYSNGGGQDIPSTMKSKLRIKNALKRFEIINPHIQKHNIFVDIGCGSGEMLEASKEYFEHHIGYDANKVLIKHTQDKSLITYNKFFSIQDINTENIPNQGIVLSINHVLEHVSQPIDMLNNIFVNLSKGDIVYIEVPLHTGYSFKSKKYEWSLWYEEHLALYSLDTLMYIANKLNMQILDKGYKNFISDNENKKMLLKQFLINPMNFISSMMTKEKYQSVLDIILKDYGFIVLQK